jgi:hypothetical protein
VTKGKPMQAKALSHREFLRDTGLMATELATGGAFGPDYAWAFFTSALDRTQPRL